MSEASQTDQARDVLWDFYKACPLPTPADVRQWQAKHPEHADVIMACALAMTEDALDVRYDGDRDLSAAVEKHEVKRTGGVFMDR